MKEKEYEEQEMEELQDRFKNNDSKKLYEGIRKMKEDFNQ